MDLNVYHADSNFHKGGGIRTYIQSLCGAEAKKAPKSIINSLALPLPKDLKVLHIHDPNMLEDFSGQVPAIYTVHTNHPYCPSGTKYFKKNQELCCNNMSLSYCLFGQIHSRCGTQRPHLAISNILRSYQTLERLKELGILIVAVSEFVKGQLLSNGLEEEQIVTILNGIRVSTNQPSELSLSTFCRQRLLFVGRLVPDKGLDWLLESLAESDFQGFLDVAGDGWYGKKLKEKATALGLSDRVFWHGWCEEEKISDLYSNCFSVVFPSTWAEPAGLVTLEAYSHRKPVIASRVGGIPEYIKSGKTGILVTRNSRKELSEAICNLSSDYNLAKTIGNNGYEYLMERFTITHHINSIAPVYERAISQFRQAKMT